MKTYIYSTQMIVGTVSSDELWLSCDHTFKSAANIGVFRSADGEWVKQYNGLLILQAKSSHRSLPKTCTLVVLKTK